MAHISFFKAKALPGKRDAVVAQMQKWDREQKPQATGFLYLALAASNDSPDEIMGVVHWDNTENYFANANRPEQDAWYQQFRSHLVADPEWFDGTMIYEGKA